MSFIALVTIDFVRISIEFPAGLINEGEVPSLAAIRELREETGQEGVCEVRKLETYVCHLLSY